MSLSFVIVQAHPDDAEAWSGGLLALLHQRGDVRLTLVTATAGGLGGMDGDEEKTIQIRKEEARKAAALVGAAYYCLDQRDGFVFDNPEARLKLVHIFREVEANIVVTHLPEDYHADHRATALLCDGATMISSLPNLPSQQKPLKATPFFYHNVPIGLTDPLGHPLPEPHFYLDITSVMETKRAMLSCHQSQRALMKHMHKIDDFFGAMNQFSQEIGQKIGVPYGECYWQHRGGGYQKDPVLQDILGEYVRKQAL